MLIENRLSPQDCADMNDIRAEIDILVNYFISEEMKHWSQNQGEK